MTLSRNIALEPAVSAVLFIDVQNFNCSRNGGEFSHLAPEHLEKTCGWYFNELNTRTVPNMQTVQRICRECSLELIYTTIENLTLDGRDRSLDYKITGFNVAKGSWDGKVIAEIAPQGDEIVLPKTSSSVFISTNIDYILRNLGVKQLVICGLLTDQCIESAIRDACDLGYLVTQITDACLTMTEERHSNSIRAVTGYCRQITTAQLLEELSSRIRK